MDCGYIDDGYSEQGFIAADEGIHGPLEFEFRPVLPAQRDRVEQYLNLNPPNPDAFHEAVGKALAGGGKEPARLLKWNLTDRGGQVVAITAANMAKLKPHLFNRLWLVVSGRLASDKRPGAEDEPQKIDVEGEGKN